jgi:hypothetical protein
MGGFSGLVELGRPADIHEGQDLGEKLYSAITHNGMLGLGCVMNECAIMNALADDGRYEDIRHC